MADSALAEKVDSEGFRVRQLMGKESTVMARSMFGYIEIRDRPSQVLITIGELRPRLLKSTNCAIFDHVQDLGSP